MVRMKCVFVGMSNSKISLPCVAVVGMMLSQLWECWCDFPLQGSPRERRGGRVVCGSESWGFGGEFLSDARESRLV